MFICDSLEPDAVKAARPVLGVFAGPLEMVISNSVLEWCSLRNASWEGRQRDTLPM